MPTLTSEASTQVTICTISQRCHLILNSRVMVLNSKSGWTTSVGSICHKIFRIKIRQGVRLSNHLILSCPPKVRLAKWLRSRKIKLIGRFSLSWIRGDKLIARNKHKLIPRKSRMRKKSLNLQSKCKNTMMNKMVSNQTKSSSKKLLPTVKNQPTYRTLTNSR